MKHHQRVMSASMTLIRETPDGQWDWNVSASDGGPIRMLHGADESKKEARRAALEALAALTNPNMEDA